MISEDGERLMIIPTIDYRNGKVMIIDQTLLPREERIIELACVEDVVEAINSLRIRGAPAIGIAAAYGVLLSLENIIRDAVDDPPEFIFDRKTENPPIRITALNIDEVKKKMMMARDALARSRPTAVNLFLSLDRMVSAVAGGGQEIGGLCESVAREAFKIHDEELQGEKKIGINGARFISEGMGIMTHCNAGGLAAAGYGTALGVIYRAFEEGRHFRVYASETRPLLQGVRLTAWELRRRGIDVTVLCEGAAASLISSGDVDAVIVGADRIARNGDTANKIGTLGLAILCHEYGKRFYVAAPWSTFDLSLDTGEEIPIEERDAEEVMCFAGVVTAPHGTGIYNPAFDVTPARLIDAIITDRGVIENPTTNKISELERAE